MTMSINRREAVQNILIASAGTVFLTGFSQVDVTSFLSSGKLALNKRYKKYLAQISETFLPINGISEKIGQPEDFILEMLNHSYETMEIEQFARGFDQYNLLMKESRLKIKSTEAANVLPIVKNTLESGSIEDDLVFFINTTKNLSIRHFTSSEYYLTEYAEYKLIPGKYNGCKEVSNSNN